MRLLLSYRLSCLMSTLILLAMISLPPASVFAQSANDKGQVSKGQVSDRAAELFKRMHEQGAINPDTATAGYVLRIFNQVPEGQAKADVTVLRKAFEQAKQIRISNDRALGRKPDIAALDAQMEANIADAIAKNSGTGDGLQTYAVRYMKKKENYRIEQLALPNDVPLERLAEQLKRGDIKFKPTYVRTWNTIQYAEILVPNSESAAGSADKKGRESSGAGFAALSFKNLAAGLVKFTTFSRDSAADPSFLTDLTNKLRAPATVEDVQTEAGESVAILSVGSPKSTSVYFEATVLPLKGYCVQSAFTKMMGAVMARDEYAGFVETSAGFWLPTRVSKEAYRLDASKVPYLYSKEDLIAFEPPLTNVGLADSTFDLGNSKEFKALPQMTHLLPKGSPYIQPQRIADSSSSRSKWIIVLVNILVISGIFTLWIRRRKRSRAS